MTAAEREDVKTVAEEPFDWDKLKGKTLLISGGTGFIGGFIINVLKYRNLTYGDGIKVISLSRRERESDETVTYLKQDVTESFEVEGEVDYCIHLASNTHPEQYAADPVGTITANVFGCRNLLEIARKKNAAFLLASSVEIYGDGDGFPMDETYCGKIDCNTARAGYNEAKRVCESLAKSYGAQYGVRTVTVRLARCFGADEKKDTKAMAQFISKAVAGEDIVLKSKGRQRYSYCYVADAAGGILFALLNGKNGEAYNVSDDDEGKTLGDYAELIAKEAGRKTIFEIQADENVSKANYAILNCDKIKREGWAPVYMVSAALKRTIKIYRERMREI